MAQPPGGDEREDHAQCQCRGDPGPGVVFPGQARQRADSRLSERKRWQVEAEPEVVVGAGEGAHHQERHRKELAQSGIGQQGEAVREDPCRADVTRAEMARARQAVSEHHGGDEAEHAERGEGNSPRGRPCPATPTGWRCSARQRNPRPDAEESAASRRASRRSQSRRGTLPDSRAGKSGCPLRCMGCRRSGQAWCEGLAWCVRPF